MKKRGQDKFAEILGQLAETLNEINDKLDYIIRKNGGRSEKNHIHSDTF